MFSEDNGLERLFGLVEASNAPKEYRTVEVNGYSFTFPTNVLHWPVSVGILMEGNQALVATRLLLGEQWVDAGVDDWSLADGYRLVNMVVHSIQS